MDDARHNYDTSIKSERCETCRWYNGHHECHRHAPTAHDHPNGGMSRAFPPVQPTDWCGDWNTLPKEGYTT